MKSFVFIIPRTPLKFQTGVRNNLFKLCIRSLVMQFSDDWEAIIVDEFDHSYDNISHIKADATTKTEKIDFALRLIEQERKKPDYLIRLDDDDIISPIAINKYCRNDFDCLADKYHFFHELISGKKTFSKRNWIPNTAIHKYRHALSAVAEVGRPLINTDHSEYWMNYYTKRHLVSTPKRHPLYMRVLSPFTITSKGVGKDGSERNSDSEYREYLKGFGRFKRYNIKEYRYFDYIMNQMNDAKADPSYETVAEGTER